MRATFLHGAADVRVDVVPDAALVDPTDAIVRVVRAGVCGSDLEPYRSLPPTPRGVPMGHELVGVVHEVGPEVRRVRRGELVVAAFTFQDNTCDLCRDGMQSACPAGGWFGVGDVGGAQAELVRVPLADGTLVAVPGADEGSPSALLAHMVALADAYPTGLHAARLAGVSGRTAVTVIGDDAAALCAVLAAHRLGAERIIVLGGHESRVGLAHRVGASDVLLETDGVDRALALTSGQGTHVVLDGIGDLSSYADAAAVVRPGGVIARVGVPCYDDAPVGYGSLFGRNITLTGGPAPARAYLEQAVRQVLDGELEPGVVVDLEVPLQQVAEAYRAMDAGTSVKAVVAP